MIENFDSEVFDSFTHILWLDFRVFSSGLFIRSLMQQSTNFKLPASCFKPSLQPTRFRSPPLTFYFLQSAFRSLKQEGPDIRG